MMKSTLAVWIILSLLVGLSTEKDSYKVSKKTMKKLCEMPEFQEAMAADEELEPAAVVYEAMSRKLETLEKHVKELENRLEGVPTQQELEAVAAALRLELLEHVDDRVETLASELETNVETILKNLMTNLANLGYEYGFELQTETTPISTTTETSVKDCSYLATQGYTSGVHGLSFSGNEVEGYCDIREDNFAWLVIQRRIDSEVDFYRNWDDYKEGFGDLMASFYLGNENIHMITTQKPHLLRIEVTDIKGDTGYAEYSNFSIGAEDDGYRFHFDEFIGGVIGDGLKSAKGSKFSTFDSDNDGSRLYSCARLHKGGFWYDRCGSANPNGVYSKDGGSTYNWQNIFWYTWKRDLRGLQSIEMKIQPSS